ncbi:MAG TPA: RtcB family protein [Vicinamibacterales bacterium]|nr:RtcB family protein [Vicinamibacterales bacterium]
MLDFADLALARRLERAEYQVAASCMERVSEKAVVFLPWQSIEAGAQQQIMNTAKMPFVFKHVAVMPDCHYGKGATVGTVLATKGAIIPAAVGVDIGCGMIAVRTPLRRSDIPDPAAIRAGIERRIPMSAGKNNTRLTESAAARVQTLQQLARDTRATPDQYDKNWKLALGTLGGGNHFIELAEDAGGAVWATLHSGSRGVGNKIGSHYIGVAQDLCKKGGIQLPDRDLAYLTEDHPAFTAYMRDLNWAQQFALHNRNEMMDRVMTEISFAVYGKDGHQEALELQRINSHHNFTKQEHHFGELVWVTRKGAIEARKDNWAMIPGSMGTRSYIVTGKENEMSFHSAPHGAGRRYSRTKARNLFTMTDLSKAMEGIEYRHSKVLLDEIPGAYKDIDQVMENAKELVEVQYILKQFVNVKGD